MLLLHSVLKQNLPFFVLLAWASLAIGEEASKTSVQATSDQKKDPYAWQVLFDGKTLKGWKTPDFFSEGKVSVADGCIILGEGNGVTGITYAGKPPRTNYEIQFQAKRLKGEDFFGSVTVPVGKEHCSVIIGGWGGTLLVFRRLTILMPAKIPQREITLSKTRFGTRFAFGRATNGLRRGSTRTRLSISFGRITSLTSDSKLPTAAH